MDALQNDRRYTYADYLTWDDGQRYELIDGMPYALAAPGVAHQRASIAILLQLGQFLKGHPCQLLSAPFDVRLDADHGDATVVQPDILVVCDRSKLKDGKSCVGAPDLAIEILSPSSEGHDMVVKFNTYLRAGVREYWIVNPGGKTVSVYVLENGRYVSSAYGETDMVPVHILEGCAIQLSDVFAE